MNISKENALIALNQIRNIINSGELCAEAMVAEIGEIIGE